MDRILSISVVGSVNLDLVATVARLPAPGETVTGASLARYPGGKGANQALAARRLGANVQLHAMVGDDAMAEEALALLRAADVDLRGVLVHASAATGVALIAVSQQGENQIVVAPGANAELSAERLALAPCDAVICQLEVPVATVQRAAEQTSALLCLNLAPARPMPPALLERANLIVVNETEAACYGEALHRGGALVATTLGARGAVLTRAGELIASAAAPLIQPVDSTGAGDAFVAALTVALLEQRSPPQALAFACAAGAAAALRAGAQPSLPTRAQVTALLDAAP